MKICLFNLSIHFIPHSELIDELAATFEKVSPGWIAKLVGHYEKAIGLCDFRYKRIIVFTDTAIWRRSFTLIHEFIHFFIDILSRNHYKRGWRHWKFDCYWQFARRILCGGRGLHKMIIKYLEQLSIS